MHVYVHCFHVLSGGKGFYVCFWAGQVTRLIYARFSTHQVLLLRPFICVLGRRRFLRLFFGVRRAA